MRTAILSAVLTVGLCIGASAQRAYLPPDALGCTPVAGKILWIPGCDSGPRDAGIPGMKLRNGRILITARPDLSSYGVPGVTSIVGVVLWIENDSERPVMVRPSRIGLEEFLPHFRAVRPKSLVWVANRLHGSYAEVATPIRLMNNRLAQPMTVRRGHLAPTLIRTTLRSQMVIGLVWFVAEPGAKRFVLEVPIAGVSYLFPFAAPQRRKDTPSDGAITLSPAPSAPNAPSAPSVPGEITLSAAQYAQALRETAAQQAKARQVSAAPAAGAWKAYQQAAAGPHGTPASASGLGTGPWTVYQRAEATSAPSRRFNDNATKAASAPDNTITVPLSSLEPTPAAPALQGGLLDTEPEPLPACAAPQLARSVYRTDLSEVRDDGKYLVMDNGSVWKVGFTDRMTTALWLPPATLYVLPTSMRCDGGDSLLVNAADMSEIVACAHPVGE